MRSQTLASARSIQVPISERDTFKLYLAENLPAEFIGVHERAAAFARLSRADVFDGRIKSRQYWGYLRYSSDLLFWGIASIRSKPPSGFVPYAFPSFIQKMGISKSRRSLRKALCNKIAKKLHTTTRRAIDFLPLLSLQGHIHPASLPSLASYYELDEEEVAGLLELSPISAQKNLPAKKQSLAKKGK
jgi:replication factor C large subunit